MFDNNYQTNVLILNNPTLYINNVRWRGIIVHMFGIRGVDIHSQLQLIFIITPHQLNTYTIYPKPIPYHPLLITNRSPIVLPFSNRPTPPLISHTHYSPNIYPYTTPYIPKNTHPIQKILIPKASFLNYLLTNT